MIVQNSQRIMRTREMTRSRVRPSRVPPRGLTNRRPFNTSKAFSPFGTITPVEETVRSSVIKSAWLRAPIRFLVPVFASVLGAVFSVAGTFVGT